MSKVTPGSEATGEAAGGDAGKGKPWRRVLRRAGIAASGLAGVALIAFFLLPVWISNEQGRTYVLQRINSGLQVKVSVEDWSRDGFAGRN